MTLENIAFGIIVVPLVIYLAVRLASAAFFKSKQTYDQQRKYK